MFGKKKKQIKELQKANEMLQAALKKAEAEITEKDLSISRLRQNVIHLTGEKEAADMKLDKMKAENKELTNRLQTNKLINGSLQRSVTELRDKVEHNKELNRKRQRKFRETHKSK